MTLDVYRGRKTTIQQQQQKFKNFEVSMNTALDFNFQSRYS